MRRLASGGCIRRLSQRVRHYDDLSTKRSLVTAIPPITVQQDLVNLTYASSVMFIGSCFSEAMAERLSCLKFNCVVNPSHGILFNPVSIAQSLARIASQTVFDADDIFQDSIHADIYHSWSHHSSFSSTDPSIMLPAMNTALREAHQHLSSSHTVFITLGSARVHYLAPSIHSNEDSQVVANCHQQPPDWFRHRYLSVEEVKMSIHESICSIWKVNSSAQIVLTVSPVRHLREGVVENSLSKSTLLCAVHEVLAMGLTGGDGENSRVTVQYFPSFEIMMDELREYRYYNADLVHPSSLAEDIIFSRFFDAFVRDAKTRELSERVKKVLRAVKHRPRLHAALAYKTHLLTTIRKMEDVTLSSSGAINFGLEIETATKALCQYFVCDEADSDGGNDSDERSL